MDSDHFRTAGTVVASAAAVGLTAEVCGQVPHINQTAIALALLLVVELIAINLGFLPATVSAIVGGAELLHFYLRSNSWNAVGRVEWVACATFGVVAMITIRLSDQMRSRTIEVAQRAEEMLLLHKFGQEILPAENRIATIERGLSAAVNIFGIEGAAFRMSDSGEVFRAGAKGARIGDAELLTANTHKVPSAQPTPSVTFIAVHGREMLLGTLGLHGFKTSPELLGMIGGRLALSLEHASALERATELEAARRCSELETAVLDSLAHDMKTPLATIKVALASLKPVAQKLPDTHEPFWGMIDEEIDRLNATMDRLLSRGGLESGFASLLRKPQPVALLIDSALQELQGVLRDRSVVAQIPGGIPEVVADLPLMSQVLKLLVDNAVKYTPAEAPLSIACSQSEGMVEIQVADLGPGIPEVERQHIFEKYYRGQNSRDKSGGLGLGLAIARTIVQAHGGKIWVTSNNGVGSIFHVAVPAAEMVTP